MRRIVFVRCAVDASLCTCSIVNGCFRKADKRRQCPEFDPVGDLMSGSKLKARCAHFKGDAVAAS